MKQDAWPQQVESCLAQIKLQHRPAFAELYQLTSAKLYGLILKMISDPELAADVLQESYTKVWQHAERYRPELGGAWPWLCQLTRNTAIDRLRQLKRQVTATDDSELLQLVGDDSGLWAEHHDLSRCLQQIRQETRSAIVSAYLYGHSHSELAVKLNTPLGTLKSWIRRGLKELQQCLEA